MKTRSKSFFIRSAAMGLLMLSGGVSRLNSTVPPEAFPVKAPRALASAAPVRRRPEAARVTSDECSTLALKATIAKARLEMRTLLPSSAGDPVGVGAAMAADRRLSERVKQTFGNSDLIMSQYSKKGECVVTLRLPLDRLQSLARSF